MKEQVIESDRRLAIGLTIGCHALLILFLLLYILHSPISPYPAFAGGSGLEVNFGNSNHGFGDNKFAQLIPLDLQYVSSSKNENCLTHELGEASNISNNNKEIININSSVVDNSKTYHRSKNLNRQGIVGNDGNQGNEAGDVNSNNYTKKTGKGNYPFGKDGNGIDQYPGYLYDTPGRKIKLLVKPDYESDEQGKIVVTITIDQNGTVIKAYAGAIGTTIPNQTMQKQAENAALKSKFDAKSDAAVEQQGTITYIYKKLN